jgi:ElaB/YqjD/DUF883 family membrane-anchored ribosome-binding protein
MADAYDRAHDQLTIARPSSTAQEGSTADRIKSTVVDKLRAASQALEEKSSNLQGQNEGLSTYGRQAARWLDKSATYIDEANTQKVKDDLQNQVRHHPGRSLLIAGAVGLVLGAIFRRR